MQDVDAVIIGSGAGGLTAALAMARAGQKVLVLEQHYLPGGWCHSFALEGYRFSPGVHYIGELAEGGKLRRIYEGLGLGGDLRFFELNPEGFDHIRIAEEQFDIPRGKERFGERLAERFPYEHRGIFAYLDTVDRIARELDALPTIEGLGDAFRAARQSPTVLRWGLRSGRALIDHFVAHPRLRAILAGQAGDHGLPPDKAPALVHASITAHYFHGGFYPQGGGAAIPRAFIRGLKRAGGSIRVRARVEKILVERGRAIGVRLADGTEIRSRLVISNADPAMTFERLLDSEPLAAALRRKAARARYSVSALSLFLAVDADLKDWHLDSGNYWVYAHDDLDAIYGKALTPEGLGDGPPPGFFLTATTLKDPTKNYGGRHTMEMFTFVHEGVFDRWAHPAEENRPREYHAFKARLKERMLIALERMLPGIREAIVFSELGTPLTNVHYLAAHAGNLYGTEKSLRQIGPGAFPIETPIRGLYLCGASTLSHGVMGATASGLLAASLAVGAKPVALLSNGGPSISVESADAPRRLPDAEYAFPIDAPGTSL